MNDGRPGSGTAATPSAALGPGEVLTTCSLSARCGTTRERGGPRSTPGGAWLLTSSTELAWGTTQPAASSKDPVQGCPGLPTHSVVSKSAVNEETVLRDRNASPSPAVGSGEPGSPSNPPSCQQKGKRYPGGL